MKECLSVDHLGNMKSGSVNGNEKNTKERFAVTYPTSRKVVGRQGDDKFQVKKLQDCHRSLYELEPMSSLNTTSHCPCQSNQTGVQ